MPFGPLWAKRANTITPADPSSGVDVTSSTGKLAFFGETAVVRQAIPGELTPSASLADVIAQLTSDENVLITYGLVER